MSFRITPEDVGRKVVLRNGNRGTIKSFTKTYKYPYYVVVEGRVSNSVTEYGKYRTDGLEPEWDVIAWADEPATDQATDQVTD